MNLGAQLPHGNRRHAAQFPIVQIDSLPEHVESEGQVMEGTNMVPKGVLFSQSDATCARKTIYEAAVAQLH